MVAPRYSCARGEDYPARLMQLRLDGAEVEEEPGREHGGAPHAGIEESQVLRPRVAQRLLDLDRGSAGSLQAIIAESYTRRGLPTTAGQIVITSGALSGIAIIARALSRPGDRIMIESPVYSNAIEALRLGGGRLISSPLSDSLGDGGWDMDGVEATLRQTSPHLAYLIPDFQNPTGFLMSDATRARYASALRATRTMFAPVASSPVRSSLSNAVAAAWSRTSATTSPTNP